MTLEQDHTQSSDYGTFETCRQTLRMSGVRGRPEVIDRPSKRRF
jgi:hypothetical protein